MGDQPPGCLGFLFKVLGIGGSQHDTEVETLPYRQRDNFLSAAELNFFHVLNRVAGNHFHVCTKVRISDLLYVVQRRSNMGHANRIDRKHVDFVLCDPKTMQPALVIELDDASHQRKDRQDRDKLVDGAFTTAGMSILHVACQRSYNDEELKQQIRVALGPEQIVSNETSSSVPIPNTPVIDREAPFCPKCNIVMVQRTASRGSNKGKRFWACPSYPECRKIIAID
jgi:very-short-patch-repair endonuclease